MSEQFVHRNRVATVATIAEGCSKSVASWTVASRSGASGTGASELVWCGGCFGYGCVGGGPLD